MTALELADAASCADVLVSPPYRGAVRLFARTIAGREALEALDERGPSGGVLYTSPCGRKAAVSGIVAESLLEDLTHDHGVALAHWWKPTQ